MIATNSFVSLIVKIMLSGFLLKLSLTIIDKTHCFVHLSFNSTLQWFNGISSDVQILLRHVYGAAIVLSSKIPFAAAVFPINLNLYLKDLPLFKMGFFWAADKLGGAKRHSPIPKICHKYRTMIKLELYLT